MRVCCYHLGPGDCQLASYKEGRLGDVARPWGNGSAHGQARSLPAAAVLAALVSSNLRHSAARNKWPTSAKWGLGLPLQVRCRKTRVFSSEQVRKHFGMVVLVLPHVVSP